MLTMVRDFKTKRRSTSQKRPDSSKTNKQTEAMLRATLGVPIKGSINDKQMTAIVKNAHKLEHLLEKLNAK